MSKNLTITFYPRETEADGSKCFICGDMVFINMTRWFFNDKPSKIVACQACYGGKNEICKR